MILLLFKINKLFFERKKFVLLLLFSQIQTFNGPSFVQPRKGGIAQKSTLVIIGNLKEIPKTNIYLCLWVCLKIIFTPRGTNSTQLYLLIFYPAYSLKGTEITLS